MGSMGAVSVQYETVPSNDTSPHYPVGMGRANSSDYVPVHNGAVTFGPGQNRQTVSVLLREDDFPEPDESFFVQLVSASLVSGGQDRPRTLELCY